MWHDFCFLGSINEWNECFCCMFRYTMRRIAEQVFQNLEAFLAVRRR